MQRKLHGQHGRAKQAFVEPSAQGQRLLPDASGLALFLEERLADIVGLVDYLNVIQEDQDGRGVLDVKQDSGVAVVLHLLQAAGDYLCVGGVSHTTSRDIPSRGPVEAFAKKIQSLSKISSNSLDFNPRRSKITFS